MDKSKTKTSYFLIDKLSKTCLRMIETIGTNTEISHIALMPDAHEGPSVPNGMVCVAPDHLSPPLVGNDLGCGVSALQVELKNVEEVLANGQVLLDRLLSKVPTQQHPGPKLDSGFTKLGLSDHSLQKAFERIGLAQLGTLGRGNHFIELACDTKKSFWILCHSGSRSMGQEIAAHYHKSAPKFMAANSSEGQAFLNDHDWALAYASENRRLIIEESLNCISQFADLRERGQYLDIPHNFVRLETHRGHKSFVHRKSVIGALKDEIGLVLGSMSCGSVVVRGLGNDDWLQSASHGCGRLFSRVKSIEVLRVKDFKSLCKNLIWREILAPSLIDESPQAYRKLGDIMRSQRPSVRQIERLIPLLNDKRV